MCLMHWSSCDDHSGYHIHVIHHCSIPVISMEYLLMQEVRVLSCKYAHGVCSQWGIYTYFRDTWLAFFYSLWFVIDIFNCSWSVNRQLTVNCDSIVLFTVNGDCLSENPVNWDLNITRDTWFRLLSVKYLGVAEIYIRRIAQNVPILMIFSQMFRGACPRTPLH